ncbi:hypothetical protein ACFP3Q_18420 [Nocardioides sp. GCM10027113]|uniref:hypothetical protein n=1 Tax=unclassified Nocardioides TaxID=2615069 RepID=UPI00360AC3B8
MLPRFETVGRLRPVDLVAPGAVQVDDAEPAAGERATPAPAPYVAAVAELDDEAGDPVRIDLLGDDVRLSAHCDPGRRRGWLEIDTLGATTRHRSRRSGTAPAAGPPVSAVALVLTGPLVTVLTREGGESWTARARCDLQDRVDVHDETWLAGLRTCLSPGTPGATAGRPPVRRLLAGGFGQLGLRDLRLVSTLDGEPVRDGDRLLLTATSAGPGFFPTAHTSVWALDPRRPTLEHRADLFFRRPDRPGVFGDHATHLVRDGDRWLVATSTWADFDTQRNPTVAVTLAETGADLLRGRHVLDTRALPLPTDGLESVGVWDPHLLRHDDRWYVGFVSASRWFRFHPALASGPSLDELRLDGAATDRTATEGTTLVRLDDGWHVLASDGRDNPRPFRARYPVLDLALEEVGVLDAPYPTNLPWPTLVRERTRDGDGWLLVTFDGTPYGGRLVGYGSHGDVVLARTLPPVGREE